MGNPSGNYHFDWDIEYIDVRADDDKWGLFYFKIANNMPAGDTISTVTFTSYVDEIGHAKDAVDSTVVLIEAGTSTVDAALHRVGVKFNYPGTVWIGLHRLVIKITFTSLAIHDYHFGYVRVKA